MPFVETYVVDLADPTLAPTLNPRNWPVMTILTPTDTGAVPNGMKVSIGRDNPAAAMAMNSVYLRLPSGALSLHSRILLEVTFDLPTVEDWLVPPGSSVPAPWAVALSLTTADTLTVREKVTVSCQFNTAFDGVRLNTSPDPGTAGQPAIGPLQQDAASCLDSPLDYSRYAEYQEKAPGGIAPLFTLGLSFCGYAVAEVRHAAGAGFLSIGGRRDHRVFSNDALNALVPPAVTPIHPPSLKAIGVSVATLKGLGRASARLRTFKVWINESIQGADAG